MAANAWIPYYEFKEYIGDGTIDLDADTFINSLNLSTSNAATLSLSGIAAVTNQHASANGYTQPGATLSAVTWNRLVATVTFDSADVVYTASGGPITARYSIIFDDTVATPVADPLCVYSLLDNTPADVTATDGNTLTLQMDASGILTLT